MYPFIHVVKINIPLPIKIKIQQSNLTLTCWMDSGALITQHYVHPLFRSIFIYTTHYNRIVTFVLWWHNIVKMVNLRNGINFAFNIYVIGRGYAVNSHSPNSIVPALLCIFNQQTTLFFIVSAFVKLNVYVTVNIVFSQCR